MLMEQEENMQIELLTPLTAEFIPDESDWDGLEEDDGVWSQDSDSQTWVRPFDQKQTGDIDASILTDHMMLQATELGLGTVWVCYFKPDVLRAEFGLPENLEPINILVVGYSDDEPSDTNRFDTQRIPMSQLVSYEKL